MCEIDVIVDQVKKVKRKCASSHHERCNLFQVYQNENTARKYAVSTSFISDWFLHFNQIFCGNVELMLEKCIVFYVFCSGYSMHFMQHTSYCNLAGECSVNTTVVTLPIPVA